ncbi:HNH endonuclease signature motif containing protein [Rhodococcus erythropolis]|uniref:HNH endonuclease signature motif containing protein n=1 Tax=Rhodococcus erythropolis TaxID=1833 RepID=UPI0034CEA2C5
MIEPCPAETVEAAHIRAFAKHWIHELRDGISLRADIHQLFGAGRVATARRRCWSTTTCGSDPRSVPRRRARYRGEVSGPATVAERNTLPTPLTAAASPHRPLWQLLPALRQTQTVEILRSRIQPGAVRTFIEIPRLRINRTCQHRWRWDHRTHAAAVDVEGGRDALVHDSYSSNRSRSRTLP